MKKYLWFIVAGAMTLVPVVDLALIWPQLPAQVPIHFNLAGEPDRMGSPSILWLLAGMPVPTFLFLLLVPYIDPKKQLAINSNYQKLVLAVMAGLAAIGISVTHATVVGHADLRLTLLVLCGMWVLLGNYIVTVPPNYFAGIRTPWTLEDPVVWQHTHRVAGRAMVVAGLLGLPLSWLLPAAWGFPVVLALLVTATLGPTLYSYRLWRQRANVPG
ncbi:SdpI family protein [Hymenobacter sp. 15J16-1T3B]|uniref:SdpI family protein n=1 Tax=Hymenobacter sp. 15J16-1T3B TaxID=2886941 RepID=UPI001D0FE15C|nr:SdpI family protein [Hymenobacter sp. 15J16-1T3B]MCC3157939.1 SdpI family protein [Hymenobacter sp. 15J16-1T3B]